MMMELWRDMLAGNLWLVWGPSFCNDVGKYPLSNGCGQEACYVDSNNLRSLLSLTWLSYPALSPRVQVRGDIERAKCTCTEEEGRGGAIFVAVEALG